MERLCELNYESFTTENGCGITLKRCVPHKDAVLFEVRASYAKQRPSASYYILARTPREARKRFSQTAGGWMQITSLRPIPPGPEAEAILTDRNRMPLR